MAQIIFLHGASSSGKSTLASALLSLSDRPYLHLSIDHLRDSGAWDPARYEDWRAARTAFFDGFHAAVAAFANCGNDIILEHILDTEGWHRQLKDLLCRHDIVFAGLHTDLKTLEIREEARGDRRPGSAATDEATIHKALRYDIVLDGTENPVTNARNIFSYLDAPRTTSAFFT